MPTKNYSAKAAKTIGKVILIFFVLSVIVVLSFKYLNSESVSIYDKSFNDIVDNSYSQVDHALITYSDGRLNMIRHLEVKINIFFLYSCIAAPFKYLKRVYPVSAIIPNQIGF